MTLMSKTPCCHIYLHIILFPGPMWNRSTAVCSKDPCCADVRLLVQLNQYCDSAPRATHHTPLWTLSQSFPQRHLWVQTSPSLLLFALYLFEAAFVLIVFKRCKSLFIWVCTCVTNKPITDEQTSVLPIPTKMYFKTRKTRAQHCSTYWQTMMWLKHL